MSAEAKVLAFFDARFCASGPLWEAVGRPNHWRWSLEPRALRQFHLPVMTPSVLGAYDLAQPEAAAAVVDAARGAGLGGFVLDCHPAGDSFVTGAEMLAPYCDDDFGLAFQWANTGASDTGDWEAHQRQCAAVVAALGPAPHAHLGGWPVLIIRRPHLLRQPSVTVAMLKHEACALGLPGLYVIANAAEQSGRLAEAGFDALVDPDPAEWVSCDKAMRDDGYTVLQILAGHDDASAIQDEVLDYRAFGCSRMVNRLKRGKVLPRVLSGFANWPDYPDGGAVILSGGKSGFYELFLRKSIAVVEDAMPPGERAVFLDSWNGWRYRSQIEPSTRHGDAVLRETRAAIQWGRYLAGTQNAHIKAPELRLPAGPRGHIDRLCAELALVVEGEG